eukprot:1342572-Pleurochrysis_carterae.AAC.3
MKRSIDPYRVPMSVVGPMALLYQPAHKPKHLFLCHVNASAHPARSSSPSLAVQPNTANTGV